jgi:hypothetical protein
LNIVQVTGIDHILSFNDAWKRSRFGDVVEEAAAAVHAVGGAEVQIHRVDGHAAPPRAAA